MLLNQSGSLSHNRRRLVEGTLLLRFDGEGSSYHDMLFFHERLYLEDDSICYQELLLSVCARGGMGILAFCLLSELGPHS